MLLCQLGSLRTLSSLLSQCVAALVLAGSLIGCQSMPYIRGQSPDEPGLLGAQAEEPAIKDAIIDIVVEGNTTIETGAVLGLIKSQRGRPADERIIKEDLRALYGTRWFYSVERRYRMTKDGLVLVFRVVERPVVKSVQLKGNLKVREKTLRKQINIEPGSPYDVGMNQSAARAIERYYQEKKSCPNAKVTLESGGDPKDRDVIFVIEEGDRVIVSDVEFTGNESFSSALLKTKLKSKTAFLGMTLFGGKYDESTLPDDLQSLRDYYQSLGYFDVKLDKKISVTKNNLHIIPENQWLPRIDARATYTYTVSEGPRYTVRNIILEGNEIFSNEELLEKSELHEGDKFNARYLNKDVERMREKYGALGRLFSRVEPTPKFISGQPGIVDVVYQIDEDRPYTIRNIDVHIAAPGGVPHTREPVALNPLLVAPGDLANPQLITKSKSRLRGQIWENGGPNAPRIDISKVDEAKEKKKANSRVSRGQSTEMFDFDVLGDDDDARRVDAEPAVMPRVRSAAEFETIIRGQDAMLAQAPPRNFIYENNNGGDPYGGLQSPLSRAFEEPSEVDLGVHVTEAQTGRLMFGAGVNSNAGVVGQFTLEENNFDITRFPTSWRDWVEGTAFRGAGQRFRLEAMPGQLVSRYMVSWNDPYFLDTDYNFGVSAFYYQRFLPGWDEERSGGRLTLGKQLDKWWSITGALRLENVVLDNIAVPAASMTPDMKRVDGSNLLSTARVAVSHDTRDSSFFPTEGHFAELAYEQGFGEFTYPRFELQGTQHFTTYERLDGQGKQVLTLHGEVGWSDTGTPMFEHFFAGGYQSFRGFAFRGVSPIDAGIRVGGDASYLGSIEYSVPLSADDMIKAVAFTDFGAVERSHRDISMNSFRLSAGFGLRLVIPMMGPAPLAFDFGFPLLSEDYDKERIFSFYVGLQR